MQLPNGNFSNERRAHPRKRCSHECKIARYRRGVPLNELCFEPARLHDLSAGGFSFRTAQVPPDAELVFLLTDNPTAGAFLAHVRSVQPTSDYFIVRCQFIRALRKAGGKLIAASVVGHSRVSKPQ
jgi:PilZ domain